MERFNPDRIRRILSGYLHVVVHKQSLLFFRLLILLCLNDSSHFFKYSFYASKYKFLFSRYLIFSSSVISSYLLFGFSCFFIVEALPFFFSTITYPFSFYKRIHLSNNPSLGKPYSIAVLVNGCPKRRTLLMISNFNSGEYFLFFLFLKKEKLCLLIK